MNYFRKNINNVRGDTYSLGLKVEEINQALESVYFTCRDKLNDDSSILFQKSLTDGISITSHHGTTYEYAIRIAPEDTKNLQAGIYYYDLEIGINDDIFTIMRGKFIIEQDATWDEEV